MRVVKCILPLTMTLWRTTEAYRAKAALPGSDESLAAIAAAPDQKCCDRRGLRICLGKAHEKIQQYFWQHF